MIIVRVSIYLLFTVFLLFVLPLVIRGLQRILFPFLINIFKAYIRYLDFVLKL